MHATCRTIKRPLLSFEAATPLSDVLINLSAARALASLHAITIITRKNAEWKSDGRYAWENSAN
jgi:hypothetical protein